MTIIYWSTEKKVENHFKKVEESRDGTGGEGTRGVSRNRRERVSKTLRLFED